ncbi:hypothetical protein [Burkholderia gladioli]|uniref:hypothetical protein n=2 Tax=Burkholderia gladioli TaxID=28095 RepID=UPI003B97E185
MTLSMHVSHEPFKERLSSTKPNKPLTFPILAILIAGIGIFNSPAAFATNKPDSTAQVSGSTPVITSKLELKNAPGNNSDPIPASIAESLHIIALAEQGASKARAASGLSVDKWYPMVVSTLAFLVSGGLGLYTFRKDAKARQQSISDEYWLRKVVSPIAIEPVVKFLLESVSRLPADCSASNYSAGNIDEFLVQYQKDHASHATNLFALGLLKRELYENVSTHFDEVEEIIINYCATNRLKNTNQNGDPLQSRAISCKAIQLKLNEMLQLVRNYQATVK